MEILLQSIGGWGYALGGALFAVLAIWISRSMATQRSGKSLVAALSLTSIWSLSSAFDGGGNIQVGLIESLRNGGWLLCLTTVPMAGVTGARGKFSFRRSQGAFFPYYLMLVALLLLQCIVDIAYDIAPPSPELAIMGGGGAPVLRILWIIGALALVLRLYKQCPAEERGYNAPLFAVLSAMWGYDLLLYMAGLFPRTETMSLLFGMRGIVMTAIAPALVLMLRSYRDRPVQASRTLTWRGLWLLAGLGVGGVMAGLLLLIDLIDSPVVRAVMSGAIFIMVAVASLRMPGTRFIALLKLWGNKHLFRHRYDYREQWMGFVDTIGSASPAGLPLSDRLLKAMADITGSSGAVLMMLDDGGRFSQHGIWNWKGDEPQGFTMDEAMLQRMRTELWVMDIGQMRADRDPHLPDWMKHDPCCWALVPLLHFGELLGTILLARPLIARPLDWEDFDMLRAAGRQVASYIAEAHGQKALEEAQRFDEFNRRFAFIMHDIKNLVSQIGLVARNAERHADNPEFRKDMVLTLSECTTRMNMLLARLSQHNSLGGSEQSLFALGDAVHSAVALKQKGHPLMVEGDLATPVTADRTAVEQIIVHLVQNAIEASTGNAPVIVRVARKEDQAVVSIIDHGCGMTADFMRDQLFRPFISTKAGGFGIGAYEARQLAQAMGGQLKAESTPGKGSVFTLSLPLARRLAVDGDGKERAA